MKVESYTWSFVLYLEIYLYSCINFSRFYLTLQKKSILWPKNGKRQIIDKFFFRNRPLTLTLARLMKVIYIFSERTFRYLIKNKIYNLLALKNSKFLKNVVKIAKSKKLWISIKTERSIFVKNQVQVFDLILWAFDIKNKEGKTKFKFCITRTL